MMFCKECGTQLDLSARFCKSCGKTIPQQEIINDSIDLDYDLEANEDTNHNFEEKEISINDQKDIIKRHKIFHSEDESLIDVLGSGYLSSLFVNESFSKSVIFCSNRRVYQRGRLFEKNNIGKLTYLKGSKCINIRDITGVGFTVENPLHRLKLFIFLLLIGIVGFVLIEGFPRKIQPIIGMISGGLIGISLISLIIYSLKKNKWFFIEYAGGCIYTNCNWYSNKSINRFMKNVSLQKDRLFK